MALINGHFINIMSFIEINSNWLLLRCSQCTHAGIMESRHVYGTKGKLNFPEIKGVPRLRLCIVRT